METLNESTSAEQRFFPIRAVPKAENTDGISLLSEHSASEKSLAVSARGFHRNFPNSRELTDLRQLHFYTGNS